MGRSDAGKRKALRKAGHAQLKAATRVAKRKAEASEFCAWSMLLQLLASEPAPRQALLPIGWQWMSWAWSLTLSFRRLRTHLVGQIPRRLDSTPRSTACGVRLRGVQRQGNQTV